MYNTEPTQRPWRISDKVPDAIICIGEPDSHTDYYGGKLIAESVTKSNAELIVKAVNCHDEFISVIKTILGSIEEGESFHCTENNRKMLQEALIKAKQ